MRTYGDWNGTIGTTVAESEPDFEVSPHPGDSAPNVVVILLDDLGFSQFGCYGSDIDTPHIDALAGGGLRYTNFHVTPLCSPTRAALLTGRNHHTVGMRAVSNFNTGFPSMTGHISNHAATVAEVLHDEGYATLAVGKWHLAPMEQCSAAGPFDQWPLQRGFDRFYGFLDGETDQFSPSLTYDNHHIEPPARSNPGQSDDGYHVSEDLIDRAIGFVHDTKSVRPDKPFFLYVAFGATHAPHQAPEEYLAKYRGKYDEGWDVIRQRWYERQIELGVTTPDTRLAPRNPGVDAWDDLPENQRKLACRLQEAFAAFLDHTDDQIGRLVDDLRDMGELDNTVIMVLGDNGASQEGGPFGVLHEMKFFNGILETPDEAISHLDEIGGPHSHTNYPWGWAQVGNTPFKWYKQNTHEGGVHVPLIVHWPAGVTDAGGLRRQFHHVNDIAATIYELIGVEAPATRNGLEQIPVSGVPMTYSFADADAPTAKQIQYFEMGGHRGLWHDGWKAVTRHTQNVPFDDDVWELYHVDVDPSECNDLAAEMPEKVREMVDLWFQQADEHGVLPLDDRMLELFGARFRDHSPHPASMRYLYKPPMSMLPMQAGAPMGGRSWQLTGRVDGVADGVLFAVGTENSGIAVFVKDGLLVLDYNAFDAHTIVRSEVSVPADARELGVEFIRVAGRKALARLSIDGVPAGGGEIPWMMGTISSVGASVGRDMGSPVSREYTGDFPYGGRLREVEIQLLSRQDAESLEAEMRAEMSRQ
ncbi:MAG: arylsulfatase [Acidimicrobiales bacterium]